MGIVARANLLTRRALAEEVRYHLHFVRCMKGLLGAHTQTLKI